MPRAAQLLENTSNFELKVVKVKQKARTACTKQKDIQHVQKVKQKARTACTKQKDIQHLQEKVQLN